MWNSLWAVIHCLAIKVEEQPHIQKEVHSKRPTPNPAITQHLKQHPRRLKIISTAQKPSTRFLRKNNFTAVLPLLYSEFYRPKVVPPSTRVLLVRMERYCCASLDYLQPRIFQLPENQFNVIAESNKDKNKARWIPLI